MMYFPTISSHFKKDEYRTDANNKLEKLKQLELFQLLKDDIDRLVFWDKEHVDECNRMVIKSGEKDAYNQKYLELKELINKLENMEV